MKNTVKGFKIRLDEVEEKMIDSEDRAYKQRSKKKKKQDVCFKYLTIFSIFLQ